MSCRRRIKAYDPLTIGIVIGRHSVQDPVASVRRVPYWGQASLLAAVYFAAAKLSLQLAIPPGYATAVWPPSGIALAVMLLWGTRLWPGVWLGAALTNFTIEGSPLLAVLIATGNTLEAVVGAALIRRFTGARGYFESGEDVVKFAALTALSATIATAVGVASLVLLKALPSSEFV